VNIAKERQTLEPLEAFVADLGLPNEGPAG